MLPISFTLLLLSATSYAAGNAQKPFSTSLRCSDGPLLPTPDTDPRITGAIFSACAEAIANAPLQDVYDAVIDFHKYPLWNTFTVSVDVPQNVSGPEDVYIGMPMTFHTDGLLPPLNTTSNEDITILDPPTEGRQTALVAWKFDDGANGSFIQAEHPTILSDLGNGSVRVVSYETYYQLGSIVVSVLLKNNLQTQFEAQASDLKAFVERGGK